MSEEYGPNVVDWLKCVSDLKNDASRSLTETAHKDMFSYGVAYGKHDALRSLLVTLRDTLSRNQED